MKIIVRKVFLAHSGVKPERALGLSLGGSGIQADNLVKWGRGKGAEILELKVEAIHSNTFPQPEILKYRKIICQGGLSTISEVLAAKREPLSFPIEGHCEQYSNYLDLNEIVDLGKYSEDTRNFEGAKEVADEIIKRI